MDILIFSIEDGRYGPARFPQMLHEAGLSVAALCPSDHLLAQSAFLRALHALPASRNIRSIAAALVEAITDSPPKLIIPADEQAVIVLQALAGGRCKSLIGPYVRAIITASLGSPAGFDASLFKSDTMALARSLGIAVPEGRTVDRLEDAVLAANSLGYPVYLKQSFSWAGLGVSACADEAALSQAFRQARPAMAQPKALVRKLFGRDWYPVGKPMDVQSGIAGKCAMYSGLAWRGQLVGGFSGIKVEPVFSNGPSKVVKLQANVQMEDVARKMVEAMGFTGFVSFDFMIPADTGEPLLIECNPRPVPVHHLGQHIGVDLAAALARLLSGKAPDDHVLAAIGELDVVLFPYALSEQKRDNGRMLDVPQSEPGLIRHVQSRAMGENQSRAA
ncbi:hypothetical protein [Novosphingobium sp.]|uniref:ATP-binding protein n=1 Tax=Novosphingobium sp. TaxID=1874826 RepID=UPI003BABD747